MIDITDMLIEDLKARREKGIETYGHTLEMGTLSIKEAIDHLYEEQLDSIQYLLALKMAVYRILAKSIKGV